MTNNMTVPTKTLKERVIELYMTLEDRWQKDLVPKTPHEKAVDLADQMFSELKESLARLASKETSPETEKNIEKFLG